MTVTVLPTAATYEYDGCLTSHEVVARSGITYRQLDYWTRLEILRPVTKPDPGSGSVRYYTVEECHVVGIVRLLLDAFPGLAIRPAFDLARHMTESDAPARLGRFTVAAGWD